MEQDSRFSNKEAEISLLGSLMIDAEQAVVWLPKIHEKLFSIPDHQNIFKAIKACIVNFKAADLVLVRNELNKDQTLRASGGVQGLIEILHSVPTAANLEFYYKICLERYTARTALKIASDMQKQLIDGDSPTQVMSIAEQEITSALKDTQHGEVVSAASAIDDISFSLGSFIPTGYRSVDDAIYGLGAGDMIVVAGRPQAGKSCLLLNIASSVAARNIPVALFSLEMTANQYLQRLLCAKAKINYKDAVNGRLTLEHQKSLNLARSWIKESKLYIDDNAFLTPTTLRIKLMQLKARHDIQACFIDYLQLMRTKDFSSLYEKTTEISKSIKSIALELQIPIVTAAQLNRESEKRDDGKPRVSDLRDSGSLEQDADIIMMINRPGLSTNSDTSECELIIGKNRRGERPICPMHFIPQYTTFVEPCMLGDER